MCNVCVWKQQDVASYHCFVHNECICAFLLQNTQFDYVQKQCKEALNVLNTNHAHRVGEKIKKVQTGPKRHATGCVPLFDITYWYLRIETPKTSVGNMFTAQRYKVKHAKSHL